MDHYQQYDPSNTNPVTLGDPNSKTNKPKKMISLKNGVVIIAATIFLGLLFGFLIGRGTAPTPTPVTATESVTATVTFTAPAASSEKPSVSSSVAASSSFPTSSQDTSRILANLPQPSNSKSWDIIEIVFGNQTIPACHLGDQISPSCALGVVLDEGRSTGKTKTIQVSLGGGFKKLTGDLILDQNSAVGREYQLEVFDPNAPGAEPLAQYTFNANTPKQSIDVDISGKQHIAFTFKITNESDTGVAKSRIALVQAVVSV